MYIIRSTRTLNTNSTFHSLVVPFTFINGPVIITASLSLSQSTHTNIEPLSQPLYPSLSLFYLSRTLPKNPSAAPSLINILCQLPPSRELFFLYQPPRPECRLSRCLTLSLLSLYPVPYSTGVFSTPLPPSAIVFLSQPLHPRLSSYPVPFEIVLYLSSPPHRLASILSPNTLLAS
jgi:hypothetical protein